MDFAQARMYQNKLGRFNSPDEFFNDTELADPASWNLYAYVRNNPLKYTDPDGETILVRFDEKDKDGNVTSQTVQYLNGKLYTGTVNDKGQFVRGDEYKGSNQYALDAKNYLNELRTDKESELGSRISTLENSKQVHTIMKDANNPDRNESVSLSEKDSNAGRPAGSTIYWSGKEYVSPVYGSDIAPQLRVPAFAVLAHELLGHSYSFDQGKDSGEKFFFDFINRQGLKSMSAFFKSEFDAVRIENDARAKGGVARRKWIGNYKLPDLKPVLKPSPRRRN